MSRFIRGSLSGFAVAAAASYSFSSAIGARTDSISAELAEIRDFYGTHAPQPDSPSHKKAYVKSPDASLAELIATKWNDHILSLVASARRFDYYEAGDTMLNWAVQSIRGGSPSQVDKVDKVDSTLNTPTHTSTPQKLV
ncbi:hypothetical protein E3P96_02449 [Wallemia ichthyophaga]|nr:hypothetical protein E3P96_02449 [Wallemia ichthyophaga]